jgi:hypothetical protein
MTQLTTHCSVVQLPPYSPSTAERCDAPLYAANVQSLLAAALQQQPVHALNRRHKLLYHDYCRGAVSAEQALVLADRITAEDPGLSRCGESGYRSRRYSDSRCGREKTAVTDVADSDSTSSSSSSSGGHSCCSCSGGMPERCCCSAVDCTGSSAALQLISGSSTHTKAATAATAAMMIPVAVAVAASGNVHPCGKHAVTQQ